MDGPTSEVGENHRKDFVEARGIAATAQNRIKQQAIRRLFSRVPGRISSPSPSLRLPERTLQPIVVPARSERIRRNMGLCHEDGDTDPNAVEGTWREFYEVVRKRMVSLGRDLYDTFRFNSQGTRRILHDSINYQEERHGDFGEMVDKLVQALGKGNGFAIFFHECPNSPTGQKYVTNICRGYEPDYDFCVFRERESDRGKYVHEPFQEKNLDFGIGGRRGGAEIGIKRFTYYPDCKYEEAQNEPGNSQGSVCTQFPSPTSGHFHVLHACSWYNQECRCLSRYFDVNKRKNSILRSDGLSLQHITNIMLYNAKWPRWVVYVKVSDSEEYRFVYRTESIREEDLRPERQAELDEGPSSSKIRREGDGPGSSHDQQYNGETIGSDSKSSRKGDIVQKIIRLFQQKPTWPIDGILKTKDWIYGPYSTFLRSDKTIKRATEVIKIQSMHYTYLQLYDKYTSDDCFPIWGANSLEDFNEYYFDLDTSIKIVEELLDYQIQYMEDFETMTLHEGKIKFCTDLYNVLEKVKPKMNTFQIVSDPGAGKSYFIDAILAFYWNTGLIQNFNRYSQFPLQEAVNRRVNLWNEPNFEPSALDTLKMLLGGDIMKANIKHEQEALIPRTPVIVTTNKNKFPNEEAFRQRVQTYQWYPAQFLKNYGLKLNPMIWSYLVKTYVFQCIDI